MQKAARELNEVLMSTSSSQETKEAILRRSIMDNHWVQKCLRGNLVQKMSWEMKIDMKFFRSMILTSLKYGHAILLDGSSKQKLS